MDYIEIKKKYPRTIHQFKEYIKSQHKKHLSELSKSEVDVDYELPEDHIEDIVGMAFMYNPRGVFDFFDAEDIKITIMSHPDNNDLWLYYNSQDKASKTATSRLQADSQALEAACELLELKLNT